MTKQYAPAVARESVLHSIITRVRQSLRGTGKGNPAGLQRRMRGGGRNLAAAQREEVSRG